jgi:hypothetical protein
MVALRDGSVVIASHHLSSSELGPPFLLHRVLEDGTVLELPPAPDHGEPSGARPTLARIDDGFAMAWLTGLQGAPQMTTVLRVAVRSEDGQSPTLHQDYEQQIPDMCYWGALHWLAASETDRTLHIVWESPGHPDDLFMGGRRIFHQRLICASPTGP